jgi:hypothetical protein
MTVTGAGVSACSPIWCGLLGDGGAITSDLAGKAASSVVTAFSNWVLGGASWLVRHVMAMVGPPTTVDLNASWFLGREATMLQVAALLIGPILAAATIGAVLRQDGRRLVRVYAVGLPVSILSAVAAVALTQSALRFVDELCRLVTSSGAYTPFDNLGGSIASSGTPPFVEFLVGAFVVMAAMVLWLEMVLRAAVIYIAVFFLPLGLAAFVWPTTAHVTKRFVEMMVTVIGSKFVIVATLSLGAALIEHDHAGINAAVTSTAILLLAAFAPFALLRLVPLVEAAATAHLEGMSRRPARAMMSAGSSAVSLGGQAAGVLGGLGTGADGGMAAGGVLPVDVAEQVGAWSVGAAPEAGSGDASSSGARRSPGAPPSSQGSAGSAPTTSGSGGAQGSAPGSAGALTDRDPGPPVSVEADPGLPPRVAAPPPVGEGTVGADRDGWSDDV